MTTNKTCADCGGVGTHDPGYHGCGGVQCRTCNGSGKVTSSGHPSTISMECVPCRGSGVIKTLCECCTGTGRVTLKVVT